MQAPEDFSKIVERKRYSVKTAALIAGDDYWDGNNWERHGRNKFLYRTPHGAYFTVTLTRWQGERDNLTPVGQDEAVELYEGPLTEHYESYTEAFPGVQVVEA